MCFKLAHSKTGGVEIVDKTKVDNKYLVFVSLCLYFYLNTRFLNDVMRKKIAIDKFKQ